MTEPSFTKSLWLGKALSTASNIMNQSLKSKVAKFLSDESGPTAVEYAVMLALIIAVCITAVGAMGLANANSFEESSTEISSAFGSN
jgi:pilus assembly protein Flp/PilA